MIALIPTLVVLLLILILLFPEAFQDLMMERIPRGARPDSNRIGMRVVPAVGVFVFGFALFQGWDHLSGRNTPRLNVPFQIHLGIGSNLLFLALGFFGCVWPAMFMERFVPNLRGKTGVPESRYLRKFLVVGKLCGILLLLSAANLLRRSF